MSVRRSGSHTPRITPQLREEKAQLNVRIAARTLGLVREYATFIESSLEYTVNAALLLALDDDATFKRWRAEREQAHTPASSSTTGRAPQPAATPPVD